MNHQIQIEDYYTMCHTRIVPCEGTKRYIAISHTYKAADHNIMKDWNKYTVSIFDCKTHHTLFEFNRNYPHLPNLLYVKQGNQEFIITSGAYQCISIYNITYNEFTDYVYPNDEAYDWGDGFCPVRFQWINDTLVVWGSLFNGPPQKMFIPNPDLNHLNFDNVYFEDNEYVI